MKLNQLSAKTRICLVIGNPVGHSLSPLIHNKGYETLNLMDRFIFLGSELHPHQIDDFIISVKTLNIRGVACTYPFKSLVIPYLDDIDEKAQKIGAVNSIVNEKGKLIGHNTDMSGAVKALQEKHPGLSQKKIAILGAGETGKAISYGLKDFQCQLGIFNRTYQKAHALSVEVGGKAYGFEELEKVSEYEIIINATTLGMNQENISPLSSDFIKASHTVMDVVYTPLKTKLLRDALKKEAIIIQGTEMLLHQACDQFKLFTGEVAPVEEMRAVLNQCLDMKSKEC